jgi:hypothetical protein
MPRLSLAGTVTDMRPTLQLLLVVIAIAACVGSGDRAGSPVAKGFSASATPLMTLRVVGADTLSDSASIQRLEPEPDGGSVAFLFADPAKGITRGLGLIESTGRQATQLVWPDSVATFWWSSPHELSFTAGTGQGVRVVVDAHAGQLQTIEVTGRPQAQPISPSRTEQASTDVVSRVQLFIDSIRVQPEGTPQGSALRYHADSVIVARTDTFAAVHVVATDSEGTPVNPAWYLAHLPSGRMQAIDSLTGRSGGLPRTAGQWGADGFFYYAKERSILRAKPTAQ